MDFHQLLSQAEEVHEKASSRPSSFKSTKVLAAKKDPKAKRLSDNVKKFLDRRKADEEAQRREAKRKKDELQQLRAESRESQKVVKRLVTKNKGVNLAVLEEAVNERDTADTLAGRNQCDEDDYGYESTMARNLYEKLMTRYEASPDDPMAKFSKAHPKNGVKDAKSTIARVKEALQRGDEPLPKFTDKSKKRGKGREENDFINDGPIVVGESVRKKDHSEERKSRENEQARIQQEQKKKRRKPQEAASFEDLLKLAATAKTMQPISNERVENKPFKSEKESDDRPMTKKQRIEFERQKQSELRKAGKITPEQNSPPKKLPPMKKSSDIITNQFAIDKNKVSSSISQYNNSGKFNQMHPSKSKPSDNSASRKNSDLSKLENNNGRPTHNNKIHSGSTKQKELPKAGSKLNYSGIQKSKSVIDKLEKVESRYFPGEKRSTSIPNKPKRPRSRSRSRSPLPRTNKKISKGGMRIESDSEYDSEMDDFIDDSDAKIDISAEIRNIFGYDRRKFRHEADFDDRSMETNRFSDVMREEARSAKIGKMEDLEDMRREEEEKKRKSMKKKHRR